MYHAPQGAAEQPTRHARLFELIRQKNISSANKSTAEVVRVERKRAVVSKRPEPMEVEFEFNTDRLLKSATNSLRRAS